MATALLVLLKTRKLKEGKHPITIRFSYGNHQKYLRVGITCFENEWDEKIRRLNKNYPDSGKRKELNFFLKKYEFLADNILRDENEITYEQFKLKLNGNLKKTDIKSFFENRIRSLVKTQKIGYSEVHQSTYNVLNNFKSLKGLYFRDITLSFLKKFEEYLISKNCSGNTISVYMRTFRTVYNEAIKDGFAKNEHYPFKSRINPNGYNISAVEEKTSKRAISKKEILKIKNFKTKDTNLIDARNFFMFSFYTMGMNFSDMAFLKKDNIVNDRLYYKRKKNGRQYSILLRPEAKKIIKYYEVKNQEYLFPIIDDEIHKTPFQKKTRIKTALKKFNRDIQKIGDEKKIPVKLTTYVARHSWATILKKDGVSVSIISQGLGHEDEKTTQIYLDSFEDEVLDTVNKNII